MTTKPVAAQPYDAVAEPVRAFPDYPPRDDMQNAIHLHKPSHQTALSRHLGDQDTTIVLSEMPLGWNPEHTAGVLIPDLMVAFNVDPAAGIAQRGYAINDRGKPPDFVLEVASLHTARNDETVKRRGYAGYRVPEYWRFDSSGRYYRNRLAGDRLGQRRVSTHPDSGDSGRRVPGVQHGIESVRVLGAWACSAGTTR